MSQTLGLIQRGGGRQIRISLERVNGLPLVDVRIYYLNSDGNHAPTQKGIAVRPDELGELINALTAARGAI